MKITRVFLNVHMGASFDGLLHIAKKFKAKTDHDTSIIFLNRKTNAFKVLVDGRYIVYFRNGNRPVPLDALRLLPERFGGSQMEFDSAVRKSLEEKLNLG